MLKTRIKTAASLPSFRIWLQAEFTARTRSNPSYSLRAFARFLQMEASSVSQILSGKRNASDRVIRSICNRLSVDPELSHHFLKNVGEYTVLYQQVAMDAFAVIADWYHYAILELTFTKNFQSSPKWIAKKLNISPAEVRVAIERLERLELIEVKNGKLRKIETYLTNGPDGFTAPALRELQRQVLRKALTAIDETPQEKKSITSMTMAIDPKKLPEAALRIKKFRRELCSFLEDGPRTYVYNLGIQLYPVSDSTLTPEESE